MALPLVSTPVKPDATQEIMAGHLHQLRVLAYGAALSPGQSASFRLSGIAPVGAAARAFAQQ
jgi:hypothetical protein